MVRRFDNKRFVSVARSTDVTDNTDCDDTDATENLIGHLSIDSDGDGFGDENDTGVV